MQTGSMNAPTTNYTSQVQETTTNVSHTNLINTPTTNQTTEIAANTVQSTKKSRQPSITSSTNTSNTNIIYGVAISSNHNETIQVRKSGAPKKSLESLIKDNSTNVTQGITDYANSVSTGKVAVAEKNAVEDIEARSNKIFSSNQVNAADISSDSVSTVTTNATPENTPNIVNNSSTKTPEALRIPESSRKRLGTLAEYVEQARLPPKQTFTNLASMVSDLGLMDNLASARDTNVVNSAESTNVNSTNIVYSTNVPVVNTSYIDIKQAQSWSSEQAAKNMATLSSNDLTNIQKNILKIEKERADVNKEGYMTNAFFTIVTNATPTAHSDINDTEQIKNLPANQTKSNEVYSTNIDTRKSAASNIPDPNMRTNIIELVRGPFATGERLTERNDAENPGESIFNQGQKKESGDYFGAFFDTATNRRNIVRDVENKEGGSLTSTTNKNVQSETKKLVKHKEKNDEIKEESKPILNEPEKVNKRLYNALGVSTIPKEGLPIQSRNPNRGKYLPHKNLEVEERNTSPVQTSSRNAPTTNYTSQVQEATTNAALISTSVTNAPAANKGAVNTMSANSQSANTSNEVAKADTALDDEKETEDTLNALSQIARKVEKNLFGVRSPNGELFEEPEEERKDYTKGTVFAEKMQELDVDTTNHSTQLPITKNASSTNQTERVATNSTTPEEIDKSDKTKYNTLDSMIGCTTNAPPAVSTNVSLSSINSLTSGTNYVQMATNNAASAGLTNINNSATNSTVISAPTIETENVEKNAEEINNSNNKDKNTKESEPSEETKEPIDSGLLEKDYFPQTPREAKNVQDEEKELKPEVEVEDRLVIIENGEIIYKNGEGIINNGKVIENIHFDSDSYRSLFVNNERTNDRENDSSTDSWRKENLLASTTRGLGGFIPIQTNADEINKSVENTEKTKTTEVKEDKIGYNEEEAIENSREIIVRREEYIVPAESSAPPLTDADLTPSSNLRPIDLLNDGAYGKNVEAQSLAENRTKSQIHISSKSKKNAGNQGKTQIKLEEDKTTKVEETAPQQEWNFTSLGSKVTPVSQIGKSVKTMRQREIKPVVKNSDDEKRAAAEITPIHDEQKTENTSAYDGKFPDLYEMSRLSSRYECGTDEPIKRVGFNCEDYNGTWSYGPTQINSAHIDDYIERLKNKGWASELVNAYENNKNYEFTEDSIFTKVWEETANKYPTEFLDTQLEYRDYEIKTFLAQLKEGYDINLDLRNCPEIIQKAIFSSVVQNGATGTAEAIGEKLEGENLSEMSYGNFVRILYDEREKQKITDKSKKVARSLIRRFADEEGDVFGELNRTNQLYRVVGFNYNSAINNLFGD